METPIPKLVAKTKRGLALIQKFNLMLPILAIVFGSLGVSAYVFQGSALFDGFIFAAEESKTCSGTIDSPTVLDTTLYGGTTQLTLDGSGYCAPDGLLSVDTLTIDSNASLTHISNDPNNVLYSAGSAPYKLQVSANSITVDGYIDVTGLGCVGGSSSGDADGHGPDTAGSGACASGNAGYAVAASGSGGGGGGHIGAGGKGGGAAANSSGGSTYDTYPFFYVGSGGAAGDAGNGGVGGAGGGFVDISASNTLTINGSIIADGESGFDDATASYGGGAGSGGAIYIYAGTVEGAGTVSANGGTGSGQTDAGGGGGGGGIDLNFTTDNSTAFFSSYYGYAGQYSNGAADGADGLVYVNGSQSASGYNYFGGTGGGGGGAGGGDTITCSGDYTTPTSFFASDYLGADLTLSGSGVCEVDDYLDVNSLTIESSATLTHPAESTIGVQITATGDVTVDGIIDTYQKGCAAGVTTGSGAGVDISGADGDGPDDTNFGTCTEGAGGAALYDEVGSAASGAGAGHAGAGGNDSNNNSSTGGLSYGDDDLYDDALLVTELYLGSGGASGAEESNGGEGGGIVSIVAGGTVTINNYIYADGSPSSDSSNSYAGGGGSGGSIYIDADEIAGTDGSVVVAGGLGGTGSTADGSGGSGGRIALTYSTGSTDGIAFSYAGGTGYYDGADGTFYVNGVDQTGGGGGAGGGGGGDTVTCTGTLESPAPELTGSYTDLVLTGTGVCLAPSATLNVSSLTIESDATLTHAAEDSLGLYVTVSSDITIDGTINTQGKGCAGGTDANRNGTGPDTDTGSGTYLECKQTEEGVTPNGGGGYFVPESSTSGGGGGHGGAGAQDSGSNASSAGATYGDEHAPLFLGSGGAAGKSGSAGGAGGGTIYLVSTSGTFSLDGNIYIDGANGTSSDGAYSGGGGSGGALYIDTDVFDATSSGYIGAVGGDGNDSGATNEAGGGGGGRIYARYNSGDASGITVAADGGMGNGGGDTGSYLINGVSQITPTNDAEINFEVASQTLVEGDYTVSIYADASEAVVGDTNVTVTLSGETTQGSDYSISSTTETIYDGGTSATFTLTIIDDDIAEDTESLVLTISSVDNDGTIGATDTHTISLQDNDVAGTVVSESSGSTAVDEAATGTTDSYSVYLSTEPVEDVVITPVFDTDQISVSPSSITLDDTNWDALESFTVTVLDDDIAEDDPHTSTITHSISTTDSFYSLETFADVDVSITDNDTAGVTVTEDGGDLEVSETGDTDTITFTLTSEPLDSVTITPTSDDDQVEFSPSSVTLDDTNWNTGEDITVSTTDNDIAEAEEATATISFTVESTGDSVYDSLAISTTSVTITDDDTSGIDISTDLTIDESTEESDTYTVELTSEPTSDVTLTLTTTSSLVTISPESLEFTSSDWDEAQTVTITAVDDDIDNGDDTEISIVHTVSSSDSLYDLQTQNATVTVNDDDTAAITVDTQDVTALLEAETTADTYDIVLASEPTADVVIALTADLSSDVTVVPSSLTFTSADWDQAQTVTITTVDDGYVEEAETLTISHAITTLDSAYDLLTIDDLTYTITSDDTAGFTFSSTELAVDEGSTTTFGLSLTATPTNQITITFVPDTQITVVPSSVTYNSTNWDTAQTVSVVAVSDGTVEEATHTGTLGFTLTANSDPDYTDLTIDDLAITITDTDEVATEEVTTTNEDTSGGGGGSGSAAGGSTSGTFNTSNAGGDRSAPGTDGSTGSDGAAGSEGRDSDVFTAAGDSQSDNGQKQQTEVEKETAPDRIAAAEEFKSESEIVADDLGEREVALTEETKKEVEVKEVTDIEELRPKVEEQFKKIDPEAKIVTGIKIDTGSKEKVALKEAAQVSVKAQGLDLEDKEYEVWYYNESTGELEFVTDDLTVDVNNGRIYFLVEHFSSYVLVESSFKSKFVDIAGLDFAPDVRFLERNEVLTPQSKTKFAPTSRINRSQFLVWTLRSFQHPYEEFTGTPSFVDVSASVWFADAVAYAESEGIVRGYGAGEFRPYATITYAEAAVMALNAADVSVTTTSTESTWFSPYTNYLRNRSVSPYDYLTGLESLEVTRGGAAKILAELIRLISTLESSQA